MRLFFYLISIFIILNFGACLKHQEQQSAESREVLNRFTKKDLKTLIQSGKTFESYGVGIVIPPQTEAASESQPETREDRLHVRDVHLDLSFFNISKDLNLGNGQISVVEDHPSFLKDLKTPLLLLEFDVINIKDSKDIDSNPHKIEERTYHFEKVRFLLSPEGHWHLAEAEKHEIVSNIRAKYEDEREDTYFLDAHIFTFLKPRIEIGPLTRFWPPTHLAISVPEFIYKYQSYSPPSWVKINDLSWKMRSSNDMLSAWESELTSRGGEGTLFVLGENKVKIEPFELKSTGFKNIEAESSYAQGHVAVQKLLGKIADQKAKKAEKELESLYLELFRLFESAEKRTDFYWGGLKIGQERDGQNDASLLNLEDLKFESSATINDQGTQLKFRFNAKKFLPPFVFHVNRFFDLDVTYNIQPKGKQSFPTLPLFFGIIAFMSGDPYEGLLMQSSPEIEHSALLLHLKSDDYEMDFEISAPKSTLPNLDPPTEKDFGVRFEEASNLFGQYKALRNAHLLLDPKLKLVGKLKITGNTSNSFPNIFGLDARLLSMLSQFHVEGYKQDAGSVEFDFEFKNGMLFLGGKASPIANLIYQARKLQHQRALNQVFSFFDIPKPESSQSADSRSAETQNAAAPK